MPFKITAKYTPKWYHLRTRLANLFINLARRIKPKNPELHAYLVEQVVEMELSGLAAKKIDWKKFYTEPEVKPKQ